MLRCRELVEGVAVGGLADELGGPVGGESGADRAGERVFAGECRLEQGGGRGDEGEVVALFGLNIPLQPTDVAFELPG